MASPGKSGTVVAVLAVAAPTPKSGAGEECSGVRDTVMVGVM